MVLYKNTVHPHYIFYAYIHTKKTLIIINNLTATRRKILKIDTAKTLYTTYIRPSLTSGLNALVLDEISKKTLIDQEKYLL